jgi:hypothetical protein
LTFQTFAAARKSLLVTGRVVGIVMASESGWVVKEIGRLLKKGIASEHEADAMVCLQVEDLGKRRAGGESLPTPSSQSVVRWLQVEKREPVGAISKEGPEKSLLL